MLCLPAFLPKILMIAGLHRSTYSRGEHFLYLGNKFAVNCGLFHRISDDLGFIKFMTDTLANAIVMLWLSYNDKLEYVTQWVSYHTIFFDNLTRM